MEVKPGYKQTEIGVIPEEWDVRCIDSLGTVVRGASPRPKGDKRFYGGDVPRLMVEDVTRDKKLVTPRIDFLTIEGSKRSRLCKRGTLTIVCSGTPGVVGLPSFLAVDACIHDGMMALVNISQDVSPDFLFHKLTSFQEQLYMSATHGGTFVNLTTTGFRAFEVALPPTIDEQRAISTALSDVDALLDGLDRLIAKKRDLKQAAMQQLLTGKTRLPGFSGEWEVKSLGEVIDLIPSGIYGAERHTGSLTGMPVATTAHIDSTDSWNDKQMNVRYFTESQVARYSPRKGDLIVVKSSGSAASIQSGKIGFVSGERVGTFIFSNFLMLLRPVSCNARYLYFQLVSNRVKRLLPQLVEASTYPNIRINDYLELAIPLPSNDEQEAIATVLSDMDTEIAALEARREKTKLLKQGMMQELLTGRIRLV
jgi:type I restriction enzyme, S subunit